jgi:Protein of unknown function (DUF1236)
MSALRGKADVGNWPDDVCFWPILLQKSAVPVGSGQNASGEAAQIEQTETPLNLSEAQRQQIRQYFASKPGQRMQSANFSLAIGAAVPQDVPLQKLPPEILSAMGGYQGNDYVLVGDQLVIVDPSARRVVALVPQIS